tara:strand:- start:50 stop:754 length:705 start_codon:yes stop_codon:yes gene_type:complete
MNRLALITGASSGIGEALAIGMSRKQYKVVLIARSEDRLRLIADKIKAEGGKSLVIKANLENEDEIFSLKDRVASFGKLSVIINNAGYGKFNDISNTDVKDWDLHININLRASFLICKTFLPLMKEKGEGLIAFINSVAGKQAYSHSTAYVSSKFGLRGFADALREELRDQNIKVVSIFPGAVNTPFWDGLKTGFDKNEMLDVKKVSNSIISAIEAPSNCVVEEILIRRVKGDF